MWIIRLFSTQDQLAWHSHYSARISKKKRKKKHWKNLLSKVLSTMTKFQGDMATWCLAFVEPCFMSPTTNLCMCYIILNRTGMFATSAFSIFSEHWLSFLLVRSQAVVMTTRKPFTPYIHERPHHSPNFTPAMSASGGKQRKKFPVQN